MGRVLDRRKGGIKSHRVIGRASKLFWRVSLLLLVIVHAREAPGSETGDEAGSQAARLTALSLEELMQLDVSIVSRKTEQWWQAAGAVDVITNEDIRRSAALTLPDALRLGSGVHVGQPNAREWAVAVRGFNVLSSNKLNVQMDGRSLFTPFFSGVLWNAQDTLLEDIDRIEVSRGPGGALWGAYAVNGFIQILTKPAWETQGWLASGGAGTEMPGFFSFRYGGKAGDSTFYRAYAKYSRYRSSYAPDGDRTGPTTDFAQAGFRVDSRGADDAVFTLLGDVYTNKGTPDDHLQNEVSGANLTGQFLRTLGPGSDFQATAYYDYTKKDFAGTFAEVRDTISVAGKYRLASGAHELQFGFDGLYSWDEVTGPAITFEPASEDFYTVSAFVQDSIPLVPERFTVTVGAQALYNGYSGFDVQPTARAAWTPGSHTTVWGAVSRAVRTPVRLDRDLVARFGDTLFFEGNDDLKPESVVSYEAGVRQRFSERFAAYVSAYVNHYDDIRSYESQTSTFMALPWTFKNSMNARSAGAELGVLWQPLNPLFIKASYRYLDLELTKDAGSGDFRDGIFEANDPKHVAVIIARLDLPRGIELDTIFRHVSRLPNPPLPGYTTADVRLGWRPTPGFEFALIAQNLFDPRHADFVTPNSRNEELARSFTVKATWRY